MRNQLLARALIASVGVGGFFAADLGSAQAAKLGGPHFPLPTNLSANTVTREALLSVQQKWLENGLESLKKARAAEQAEDKAKDLDKLIGDTEEELKVAKNDSPQKEVQAERKKAFLLNLNQWINELNHQATENMKAAIMKDGMEAMAAQNAAGRYSEIADDLEKAKMDNSIEEWGKTK